MSNLTVFNYNGQVISRRDDGYLNASEMCQANGKLFADWSRLKSTKAYTEALSVAMGITIGQLMEVRNGNQTWIHPSLAINLARWISPAFAVWCDGHIFNLLSTGSTAIATQPRLPQRDAIAYIEAAKEVETINNLSLQQLLRDELIDELSAKRGQKQLAGDPVQYTIVKVRARELGYSTADIGNGSALGKFVAKAIAPAFIERVGKYEVKHYQVNDALDTAIKTYFGMKHSLAS